MPTGAGIPNLAVMLAEPSLLCEALGYATIVIVEYAEPLNVLYLWYIGIDCYYNGPFNISVDSLHSYFFKLIIDNIPYKKQI